MLINEFHAKFTSEQERSRLFDVLRHMSRLEKQIFLASGDPGWAEWPPFFPGPGLGLP
ncbi:MAG TPA: hypothetical protein VGX68_26290 [Thermoanaerobaculia bacterium]|jgi:hypothetical protein|nr:hypothetical protein [Thermoanaerobaculia bacterium]